MKSPSECMHRRKPGFIILRGAGFHCTVLSFCRLACDFPSDVILLHSALCRFFRFNIIGKPSLLTYCAGRHMYYVL